MDDVMKYLVLNFFDVYNQSLNFVRLIVFERNFFSFHNIEMESNVYLLKKMKQQIVSLMV
jgi:hypothetical protein